MSTQKERFEEYRKGFLEGVRINKIDVLKLIDECKFLTKMQKFMLKAKVEGEKWKKNLIYQK